MSATRNLCALLLFSGNKKASLLEVESSMCLNDGAILKSMVVWYIFPISIHVYTLILNFDFFAA